MAELILRCPHCGFARTLPAEKVPERPVRVTCPKCRESFSYRKPAIDTNPPPAQSSPPPSDVPSAGAARPASQVAEAVPLRGIGELVRDTWEIYTRRVGVLMGLYLLSILFLLLPVGVFALIGAAVVTLARPLLPFGLALGPTGYRPYSDCERDLLHKALLAGAALADRASRPGVLAEADRFVTDVHAEVVENFEVGLGRREIVRPLDQSSRLLEMPVEIIGPPQAIDDGVIGLAVIEAAPQQPVALFQTFGALNQRIAQRIEPEDGIRLFREQPARHAYAVAPGLRIVHENGDVQKPGVHALVDFVSGAHVGRGGGQRNHVGQLDLPRVSRRQLGGQRRECLRVAAAEQQVVRVAQCAGDGHADAPGRTRDQGKRSIRHAPTLLN